MAEGRMEGGLEPDLFPQWRQLLDPLQGYALKSGCRYDREAFQRSAFCVAQAAEAVSSFEQRLKAREPDLLTSACGAVRLVMGESLRCGIVATAKELDLFPPNPTPNGVPEDDYTFQDTDATLPEIAQRVYNDEMRRASDPNYLAQHRRYLTASFLSDFVESCGINTVEMATAQTESLQEFMARVEEWTRSQSVLCKPSVGGQVKQALLQGLQLGGDKAGVLGQQVQGRWAQNWETQEGTLINLATVGVALLAGGAVLSRALKKKS